MVMGSILPIVLVTLCLLLYGDVVSGLKDGGRRIRRIKAADLPLTSAAPPPRNSTTLPVATSKTVASVVAEDILQSGGGGGGISAPGSTNISTLPTAPSYDSYLFGTSEDDDEEETPDFGTVVYGDQVEQQNGRKKTNKDKHAVSDALGYPATLTTPRMSLFDEHHSQVSEGIRQRLEELEERFHSSHSPSFETSPSSESYSRLTLEPENKENGTMELDYSNRFSLVLNETYDPPRNIHRETVMENATRLNMKSTMLVHKEYQETELNSNLSTKNPTIVSADVKKKKKIIVLLEATTEISDDDSKPQESQSTELPEETNFYHSTGPPGDRNSTTPLPDIRGRSISQRLSSDVSASTTTKEILETSPQIKVENGETKVSNNDTIVTNISSSEVEEKGRRASLRNYSTTERFTGLLQSTTEGSAIEQNATEGARGGRMLVNENSTNSLGAEASQVPPSPVAPSAEQGDKMGMRTKTTLRRLNRTESQSSTLGFMSSTTETITTSLSTTPSATTEWRGRNRSYPQRRPYAAAAITTSDSMEESTTKSSRRPTPRRRPPVTLTATTLAVTSTTESNTIAGLRPTWRRQTVADNRTENTEGNDLKPNRGRGSIRYGNSELAIPATATAWTLVSLRSPPSSNTTRLVRQPDTEKPPSTRGRRPATSTTQSSMQENRVSMVQVLAPLLVGEELANLSQASNSNTTAGSSEDIIATTEPSSSDTTTNLSSTLTTIANEIATSMSDIFTTQMPSKEESIVTESSSNKILEKENSETVTVLYDSTTLGTGENTTTTEAITVLPSEASPIQYNIPDNSSETENDSSKSNETTTNTSTTFFTGVDNFFENSTNGVTKLSNHEKEFDSVTELFNMSTAEPSTEDFHSVISSVNTTIYSDETTTLANIINYSENVTAINSAEMYTVNTTVSFEVTTFPQMYNISESNSTLALYSTNVTMDGNTATTTDHVTKLVDADDDLLSVTPLEAEEDDDSSTQHIPSTTGTPSMESGEDDVHVFTHREDPDEEGFDQTTTTSSSIDNEMGKQTTTLFLEKDITKETTTESRGSSSVSEIDWEQPTTIRPPEWDSTVGVYLLIVIDSSWEVFCSMIPSFRTSVTEKFRECTQKDILPTQVVLDESSCNTREGDAEQIEISMYLINEKSEHDALLTTSFGSCFGSDNQLSGFVVEHVEVMPLHEEESEVGGWGVIAAIAITCVGAVCLLIFLILMVILRKRQKKLNYGQRCTPVSLDAYSLDSVSICGSTRRKGGIRASKRSYGNAGFDDPGSPSHPMGFAGLANFVMNRAAIDEEFAKIPQVSASVDELPEGTETRNRYANVIPLPETRVTLNLVNGDPLSHYINANFVRGPKEESKFYIACQAPLPSTVTDFWRMIWEQQSRAILMLTELVENGVEKCADYLPPSEVLDCHRLFGDFQVTLKKREVKEKYIISTLQLKNLETNSWREVSHLWYVDWPAQGVPAEEDTASVIAFLLEARPHMRGGPTVVHCSPGTGRTGTVIACDLCIRDFETTRIVDVPRTVARIRRDRAGAVQTRDQYAFIYQVMNLYGMKLTGGALDSI